jgi:trk system potassium uptake protein TrkA
LHARILALVGAHQVVNPEREFGNRFANQIVHESIRGELPLGEGVLITELSPPPAFVGGTLGDLQLPKRFGVTVVAIRKRSTGAIVMPDATAPLEADDVLVVVAKDRAVEQMMDRN